MTTRSEQTATEYRPGMTRRSSAGRSMTYGLALLTVLLAADAVAQAQQPPRITGWTLTADPGRPNPDTRMVSQTTAQAGRPPQPPRPPRPRRRASMVGYIEDATVASMVRVRFDSGLHDEFPDRAEFFYAKCGCYSELDVHHPGYDADAPGPKPGAANDLNFQQLVVRGEAPISSVVSFFGELPLRWIQPQSFVDGTFAPGTPTFSNQAGLSDIRVGAKFGVSSTADQSATVQLQLHLPTGKSEKGLGTNHASIEPAFLFRQQVHDKVGIESQFGFWIPFGGSAGVPVSVDKKFSGNVLFYGAGASAEVIRGAQVSVSPVVELVGWHVLGGFQSVALDASGINIVNLKIGARVFANDDSSFYVGWGHALTTANWYADIVRFEYRYAF